MTKRFFALVLATTILVLSGVGVAVLTTPSWMSDVYTSWDRESPASIGYIGLGGIDKAIDRFPREKREALRQIFKTLTTLPKEQLDFLKASDPCIDPNVLDCTELTDIDSRRFLEGAIAHIYDKRTTTEMAWTRGIALASLFLSFLSLLVAFAKHRRDSAVK